MLKIYNGKFALLLLLKESGPAVLSLSSMWVHSINNDRETHGEYGIILEYGIIFIGIWHHIYWNVASCLFECGIIFIRMWHHIYWNVLSYLLEYVIKFIWKISPKQQQKHWYINKTSELFIIPEFCFIISQYIKLWFEFFYMLIWNANYICLCIFKNIVHI